jgi:hypothetical protein
MARLGTLCLLASLFGLESCASGQESSGGFYRGRVLDTDTGKPLAGVVVTFIWERDVYSPSIRRVIREFHAATEVLTATDGRFQVSTAPEESLGPSVLEVRLRDPVFFAPGYFLPYKARRESDSWVIPLTRAVTIKDLREHLGALSTSFSLDRTPLLRKALNAERARLGLPQIPPGKEGKGSE